MGQGSGSESGIPQQNARCMKVSRQGPDHQQLQTFSDVSCQRVRNKFTQLEIIFEMLNLQFTKLMKSSYQRIHKWLNILITSSVSSLWFNKILNSDSYQSYLSLFYPQCLYASVAHTLLRSPLHLSLTSLPPILIKISKSDQTNLFPSLADGVSSPKNIKDYS